MLVAMAGIGAVLRREGEPAPAALPPAAAAPRRVSPARC
jgi:hypothetical protein